MRDKLLRRMGEVRDAIEVARRELDTAALVALIDERDDLRESLLRLQMPSRADLQKELDLAKAHLEGLGFTPAAGMLLGMTGGGSGGTEMGAVSSAAIVAARRAQTQGVEDSSVKELESRIAMLEERLKQA